MQPLRNSWFLALNTCREGIRHRALWAIICLAVVLTLANIVVTELFSWDLGKVSVEFGLSAVALTGLLIVFFLAIKIMVDDLEQNRITMLLCRPVTMTQYIFGKFFGLSIILFLSTLILGGSAALSMQYVLHLYPGYVPPGFSWMTYGMALICQLMSLNVMLAVIFFWFSFASQSFVALIISVATYLVGQNMELLRRVINENPQAGILAGQEKLLAIISWIFPNLSLFDKKYIAAYGLPFTGHEFLLLFFYSVSYCLLLLWLSVILFQRKDLS